MHILKKIKDPFIISGLFLLFSVIFLFIFFNKTSRDSVIEQIQHRQQMSVRAGANSIDTLLNSLGRSAVILANNPDQDILDSFTQMWADSGISGLVVTDKNGIVVKNSNPQGIKGVGIDLSDRDYFKWAKKSEDGLYSVFSPVIAKLGPVKGQYVVTISSPVFSKTNFDGVLTIAIPLSELTHKYIQNLKVLDSSKVYLIAGEGDIVYSDLPELSGKNIKDIFQQDFLAKEKIIEILLSELKKNDESKLKLAIPNFENNQLETYLISAAPINVSDQLWKLVVVTSEKDLTAFTFNVLSKQIMAVFVIIVLFLIVTLRASRNKGYEDAVIDEHKIHKISS